MSLLFRTPKHLFLIDPENPLILSQCRLFFLPVSQSVSPLWFQAIFLLPLFVPEPKKFSPWSRQLTNSTIYAAMIPPFLLVYTLFSASFLPAILIFLSLSNLSLFPYLLLLQPHFLFILHLFPKLTRNFIPLLLLLPFDLFLPTHQLLPLFLSILFFQLQPHPII